METNHYNLVVEDVEEEVEESLQGRRSKIASSAVTENGNGYLDSSGYSNSKPVNGTGHESPPSEGSEEDSSNNLHNNSVFFDKIDGTESADGISEMNSANVVTAVNMNSKDAYIHYSSEIQKIANEEMNENEKFNHHFAAGLTLLEELHNEHNTTLKSSNNENGPVDDLVEEIDQEETEFDVERVLEKQNTHDLYCPNCNSCITRRVILCRRKGKVRTLQRKPKKTKLDTISSSNFDVNSANSPNVQGHETENLHTTDTPEHTAGDDNRGEGREVFRCLSCFSFFIPTGDGFKLFRPFGNNPENKKVQKLQTPESENVQNIESPENVTSQNLQTKDATKTNWFFSMFATHKIKKTIEQGSASQEAGKEIASSSTVDGEYFQNAPSSVREKPNTTTEQANKDSVNQHKKDNLAQALPGIKHATEPVENDQASSILGTPLPTKHIECKEDAVFSASVGIPVLGKQNIVAANTVYDAVGRKAGGDVILNVETKDVASAASQVAQNVGDSTAATSLLQPGTHTYTRETDAGVATDILKSIVYGGLVESITILGVVSSAAAAGSATLNILALGLANVIGGIFIIGHNLIELRNTPSDGTSNQSSKQEDRYQVTLGRRENFVLHAVAAIISFLIFGMLPPVLYGFTFRKSDDKDLKLAVVGGASLVCIILLSIGKAHIRRPPKSYVTTMLYYLVMGVLASGACYIAGDIIAKLLQKTHYSGSSFSVAMPFSETRPVEQIWASF